MVFRRSFKRRRYSRSSRYGRKSYGRYSRYGRKSYGRYKSRRYFNGRKHMISSGVRRISTRDRDLATIPQQPKQNSTDYTGWRAALAAGIGLVGTGYNTYKKISRYGSRASKIGRFAKSIYKGWRRWRGRKELIGDFKGDPYEWKDWEYIRQQNERQRIKELEARLAYNMGVEHGREFDAPLKKATDPWAELSALDRGRPVGGTSIAIARNYWNDVLSGKMSTADIHPKMLGIMRQYRFDMLKDLGVDIAAPDRHDLPRFDIDANPGIPDKRPVKSIPPPTKDDL